MNKHNIKIGELFFSLIISEDPEVLPSFEIENESSIIFQNLEIQEAIELRDLLEQYIQEASNS
jgi:hypothetical protein